MDIMGIEQGIHLVYGNPEDLKWELMLYKGLLYKAGLSVDGDPGR